MSNRTGIFSPFSSLYGRSRASLRRFHWGSSSLSMDITPRTWAGRGWRTWECWPRNAWPHGLIASSFPLSALSVFPIPQLIFLSLSSMMLGKAPEIAPSVPSAHGKRKKPDDELTNGLSFSAAKKQRTRVRFVHQRPLHTCYSDVRLAAVFLVVNAIAGSKRCDYHCSQFSMPFFKNTFPVRPPSPLLPCAFPLHHLEWITKSPVVSASRVRFQNFAKHTPLAKQTKI